jgi:hypothetical protein
VQKSANVGIGGVAGEFADEGFRQALILNLPPRLGSLLPGQRCPRISAIEEPHTESKTMRHPPRLWEL